MNYPLQSATSNHTPAPVFALNSALRSCSGCSMHQICLPTGLNECDTQRLDKIIGRRKVPRDSFLYRIGDPFTSLYAVRVGHFKSYQQNIAGDRQITGFPMTGELLGMDAINTERYQCDAVALEDSEVCEIPFELLENLFAQMPTLLHHFHRALSQEITNEQRIIMLLGNMRAEQRFASFLINLSMSYATRGYSATRFQLRMTREDIGNHLGLTIESISRMIAKMRRDGLIQVRQRDVEILNLSALGKLASGSEILVSTPVYYPKQ
ncbi:fumarate/nitrate reduction transcriptional regulator Fnr [Herbaspirillum rhizosphaerae]|uniref:Fumarate/nitrate reduction transcriptional regulator Fnr n=1 Tax=Herbaspirillum rhizosphaerae TaxID=346179 RepID=A0ABW8ZCF6_9BURK